MDLPENPTPHIAYNNVEGGDRSTPILTDYTTGGSSKYRIWQTKENDNFFEYCQYNVMKNSCMLGCAYHRTNNIKCPGRMTVKPELEK